MASAAGSDFARDYAAIALDYAKRAVADKKGEWTCNWARLACKRHLDDLKRKRWDFYFDPWYAGDVCDFIEKLPHVQGKWDSKTISLEPWQIFFLCVAFGWRRRSDGGRRFTMAYLEVARKNAKSTILAGISLYGLCCDDEPGAQVYIGATTGDQAKKVFEPAAQMVKRTSALREAFDVEAWARSITLPDGSFIQPINAKSSTQDGHNPSMGILDELHAHADRGLYDVVRSADGARDNPFLWMITTSGYNVEGVCYEQRTLLTKVLQGLIPADHYFGIIYTLDEEDSEFDERVWVKANPNLGASIKLDSLKRYAVEAKNSPASHAEFKTKRCNIWTSAKDGWVNIERWKKCDGAIDLDALKEAQCWGGLDLASTTDMAAFRLVWKVGGRLKTWGRFYLPEEAVRPRTERGNVPYQTWEKEGLLTVTPGDVTDYEYIKKDILRAMGEFDIVDIAYDPWNARDLVNRLMEESVPLIEFRQGIASFNAPMKELERAYTSGQLDHDGDPILTWNASNIVARQDVNENIAPDKKHSTEKIDGFVALVMAIGRMLAHEDEGPSVYAERGALAL